MDSLQDCLSTRRHIVAGSFVVDWIAKTNGHCGTYSGAVGIGVAKNGHLLGGIAFCDYRGVSIQIHTASTKSKTWVTREWLHVMFDYAFRQLKVKKIFGIISAGNDDVLRFGLKMGFKIETRIADVFANGDALVIYITPAMCKWLDYGRFPSAYYA